MSLDQFDTRLGVQFADAKAIRRSLAYLCQPTNKTPVQAADEDLWISDGTDVTKFLSTQVPYMREPLDCLARRIYEAVIVVGPARSGKTKAMVEGWINYSVTQAPGDMLLIYSTKTKAADMSKVDLDRCFHATPGIAKLKTGRKSDDNITSKKFKNGMNLKLDSATETSLSASTYRYAGCTDYDRADDSVGEEGSKFELMLMRVQNAKSSGMVMAESSPGRIVRNPKPIEELAPHEAQPCGGIASLYNQGDRRRFYWQCDDCEAWFRPDFETLKWVDHKDPMEAAKTAWVECPRCTHRINESQKQDKNLSGEWFREGAITQHGELVDDETKVRTSKWATFWFEGIVAAYASWENLVYRYLNADAQYQDSGDEEALKSFINTRMGRSYILQSRALEVGAHELMQRALDHPRSVVPNDGRFIIMTVDVQGGKSNPRFIVQAHVYGLGLQRWVIDRFEILTTKHRNGDRINPAVYSEDWDLLIDEVMKKTYPLADGSGRVMKPILTLCDSGGSAGEKEGKQTSVTDFAYQFYNRLKSQGLAHLFRLVKGASRDIEHLVKESYPDKRSKIAHGEIKLLLLHTNRLKNRVTASYSRLEFGSRYFHLPGWAERNWFDELTAEYIDDKGNWVCPPNTRNESLDLCAYAEAGMHYLGGDDIDWNNPPAWASPWQINPNVVDADVKPEFERKPQRRYNHSQSIYG
ncbi:phage terminase large subunit family protein [Vibrio metschnikovii]|uniref:Phage terminase large subunit family protein n=1 Tax=bacterium 19PA01SH03 TaxID=2920705 RepID=A0AAU6SQW8_UNCXX|nr:MULTISPECIES: terminase gpA endonuclease subunit [unclassified Vibrio]EKO3650582.1 phage terminase large subunit family protein [Vibrio metschnikovii]EKO3662178.1 phage terminase large subunit family protein [Vibrio metschnikovii]EKO3731117.1 phage terminase large subunit family protein [Vibrio metschnikovii]EKO3754770.1 phage terminase large subunit family protein [Vibrio metschnikovii]MDQ2107032.1 DNA packaging protein [Vibrio sp. 2017_1457_15]